jgi:adenylate cyclase class 2
MSFEIEQKYRTTEHPAIAARLRELGAESGTLQEQEDAYLNHPSRDFAVTKEALRLRRTGHQSAITYKGPRREGPTKTREEIEVPISDPESAWHRLLQLFEALGFRTVAVIRKARTPYHLTMAGRKVEIVLDVAEGLGTFVEVETIVESESEMPDAQRVVLELAEALGLAVVEPRSYLRMALEMRAAKADLP